MLRPFFSPNPGFSYCLVFPLDKKCLQAYSDAQVICCSASGSASIPAGVFALALTLIPKLFRIRSYENLAVNPLESAVSKQRV
jgi:hypothetical protein